MRRTWIALLALAAAGGLAAGSTASDQRAATIEAAFPPGKLGAPAAVDLHMTWADPGEPNAKPQGISRLTLRFPPGVAIDSAALRRCGATDKQIAARGASACPKGSRLGTGQSKLTSGSFNLDGEVTLMNAKRQVIVLVRSQNTTLAVYRDTVTRRTVTVNFKLPAALSLLDLRIHIPVHTKGRGAKRRVYFHTPAACPAEGSWPMPAITLYKDGSSQTATTAVPCAL